MEERVDGTLDAAPGTIPTGEHLEGTFGRENKLCRIKAIQQRSAQQRDREQQYDAFGPQGSTMDDADTPPQHRWLLCGADYAIGMDDENPYYTKKKGTAPIPPARTRYPILMTRPMTMLQIHQFLASEDARLAASYCLIA